jgi:hypothetical protein
MGEERALDFWVSDYRVKIQVNPDSPNAEQLDQFFKFGFERRDQLYGEPRVERYDSHNRVYTTSLWELAESFFTHFTSNQFADLMQKYASTPDGPMESRVIASVRVLDQFLHYAYAFKSKSLTTKWSFWQIYAPNYTTEELKRIIPKRMQSRSKIQGVHLPPHSSPLLIGSRLSEYQKQNFFTDEKGRARLNRLRQEELHEAIDQMALRYIGRTRVPQPEDQLQLRFFRRWGHPIMIFNLDRNHPFVSTINNLDGLLELLCLDYPRLTESPYDLSGQPLDFKATYLQFGSTL